MSGVYEGLTDRLASLKPLDEKMKWRGNWAVGTQYYRYDVVRSPTNGIEYVLGSKTAVIGGLDPGDLANLTGDWTALGGIASSVQNPTFADGGAGTYTITGGNLLGVPAFSRWLITYQGDRTNAGGNNTPDDTDKIIFTAPGGDSLEVHIIPNTSAQAPGDLTSFTFTGQVQAGLAGGDIVMTGFYNPARAAATYSADKITFIRLA